MFPRWLQTGARRCAEAVVGPLARHGVTPNTVTIVGFLLNVLTAGVLATGHLTAGGALLVVSGLFDMLDGALARVASSQTDFGAFLDSLLDRYSEAAILLALLYDFTVHGLTIPILLVYAVAIGSILISYARARAEGLGVECNVGIAPRPERIFILAIGLLINRDTAIAALCVLALLTHVTAMQRLYHVYRQTHQRAPRGQQARRRHAKQRETSP